MNELEQNLLFGMTTIVLAGTLVVFVVQFARGRRKGKDERDDE
ncbi:MAG: hypothetical protein QM611_02105 [Microbacterium sp.]